MIYRAYKIGSDRAFLEMLHKLGGHDPKSSDTKTEEEDAPSRKDDTAEVRGFVEGVNKLVVGNPTPKKHDTSKTNGPPINKKERWSSPVTISSGRW